MSFIWPFMLFLLVAIPIGVILYVRYQQRRKKLISRYGSLGTVRSPSGRNLGVRRHIPPAVFLAGLAILVVAMARPQTTVQVPRIQGTVILAFDVSGSMAATDIQPSRLAAAKVAVDDFIQRQPPDVQIGVVAFSDGGFQVQEPTNDQTTLLASIAHLTPQHGTSLANGINASLNAIAASLNPQAGQLQYSLLTPAPTPSPTPVPQGIYSSAVIILLTDGENNENPDPMAVAQVAADRGVRIDTVGIGSPQGTTLNINGFNVFTQLDEATLQQISQTTGGTYYNAQSAQDLKNIYDNLNTQLIIKPQKIEVTSLFAGASILVLLAGGFFSLLWFNRLP